MPVTLVAAFYATGSLLLQRIYIPHNDDAEIRSQPIGAGESMQTFPTSLYRQQGPAGIQAAIGTPTFSGRCAVVDAGNAVIDIILADPALFTDPRGQLIASDNCLLGDLWNGTNFGRIIGEVDHVSGNYVSVGRRNINNLVPLQDPKNFLLSNPANAVVGQPAPIAAWKLG